MDRTWCMHAREDKYIRNLFFGGGIPWLTLEADIKVKFNNNRVGWRGLDICGSS
jgi:hypothetical protein